MPKSAKFPLGTNITVVITSSIGMNEHMVTKTGNIQMTTSNPC